LLYLRTAECLEIVEPSLTDSPSAIFHNNMATAASAGHGGLSDAALKAALAEASLVVHCPPDIPLDTEIVGVCAVDEIHAVPNGLGWIAADFIAWKTLFHNVGQAHHQVGPSQADLLAC
jgi:hypothetical protein